MESQPMELDQIIGFNGKFTNTVHCHPTHKDMLVYNVGSLVVVESLTERHNQQFLRGHDMQITCLTLSNSGNPLLNDPNKGKMIASGQMGTQFQKMPEAPIILWDFEKRSPIFVLKGIQINVKHLAFSPDDRFLAGFGTF